MKTPDSSIRSQLTTLAVATAISLSFASLAEAETVRVKLPASKQGQAPVRVISSGNEGPAPARVTVTTPPISKQHALELENAQRARKMAEINKMAQDLRNKSAGATPDLLDQGGGTARRESGSAADRAGNLPPPVSGTDYKNPLGEASAGIDARLRGNSPRAKVVGPGGLPTDSTGLAADTYTKDREIVPQGDGSSREVTTETRSDSRTGATLGTTTVFRDKDTGTLLSFSRSYTRSTGEETILDSEITYAGRNHDVPLVTQTVTHIGPDGERIGDKSISQRAYIPGADPPIRGSGSGSVPGSPRMPTVDGTGDARFHGPMGMVYNPATGQWSAGMALEKNQVKPGCEAALPTGPRVRIDQKAIVTNPDPDALQGARALRRIERSGMGPGQRPPTDPDASKN